MLFSIVLWTLFLHLGYTYDICCPLFQVTEPMLQFLSLSIKHEAKWRQLDYIPSVYNELTPELNQFVTIAVDEQTARFFFNSQNNYTRCYDCQRIDHSTSTIHRDEQSRVQWVSNYVKFSQHDYTACQNQLDKQNWTTGYIVAAVSLVLVLFFLAVAAVSWVIGNLKKIK